ncbi:citrate lyase holo-[acyl-carrier protein] synthase [Vibrio algarum]|uniref:citrate lyase holo-[acyl-carrier protein] synthase n=1 Tax=Vibrio algarum TaxID=3020714 RepID=A0ABT4YX72_9VIBR|nr:citrate lyase holo-[acyl-carrier protein] synthase [Vibrio sp. KJ40-1]MDB1126151.1 citrate lyase holo-[acyl-carrier protein] synthase [Vibrio sp. KJ40-1]
MHSSISLYDSYLCKETRAKKQQQLVKKFKTPVITIKAHMPKELRKNGYVAEIIEQAFQSVKQTLSQQGFIIVASDDHKGFAGEERYLAVQCRSASELKKFMMEIENSHSLGQLMDLNVMDGEGKTISRGSCKMSARKCIICNCPAPECAKRHQHNLEELNARIEQIIEESMVTA